MSSLKKQISFMFESVETKCSFSKAWIGACNKQINDNNSCCEEHRCLKCCSCGEQATHECPETMGLVCGAPLCSNCEHTICENGCNSGASLPPGLKSHCKKNEQVYKPWYTILKKQNK